MDRRRGTRGVRRPRGRRIRNRGFRQPAPASLALPQRRRIDAKGIDLIKLATLWALLSNDLSKANGARSLRRSTKSLTKAPVFRVPGVLIEFPAAVDDARAASIGSAWAKTEGFMLDGWDATAVRSILRIALASAGLVEGYEHVCRWCSHKERHADNEQRYCPKCFKRKRHRQAASAAARPRAASTATWTSKICAPRSTSCPSWVQIGSKRSNRRATAHRSIGQERRASS